MSLNEPTNKRFQVYREAMMNLAQMMCAPFWWSVGEPGDRATNILNNGTICYVVTGTRKLGVTANHVYQTYVRALQKHGAPAIECQFGSSTIYPEPRPRSPMNASIRPRGLPGAALSGAVPSVVRPSESVLDATLSPVLADALSWETGTLETSVLPHSFLNLLPLVGTG